MPVGTHLQWFDIDDMTAGLWDSNAVKSRFSAPSKAFRTLTGYMAMKGGGVRASFVANTTISMSGVGANECIIGIWARNGVSRPVANGGTGVDSTDMVIVTMNTSDFKFRIYRRDGTVGAPAWSLRFTSTAAASSAHQITDFAYFKDSAGVEWLLMSIFAGPAADAGLYSMRFSFTVTSNTGNDGLVAKQQTYCGPLTISQARVMVGTGNDEKIHYSDTGLITFTSTATQVVSIAPNRAESNVSIISNIEPADLIIGKEGAPWVVISGDITSTSTPIREMGDDHHQRQDKQQVPRVPGGIAFIEGQGRCFVTNDGRQFQSISDQLAGFLLNLSPGLVGTGTMAYLNSLLFAPGPGSTINVYDFDTNAWHRMSDIDYVFGWADPYGGTIWCANHSTTPAIVGVNVMSAGSRTTTGVIQTVEFADKNGRNVDIREVQLFVDCTSASSFLVELIDQSGASVANMTVSAVTNKQVVQFLFPNTKSEYLAVKITPSSDNGSSEAPRIERIRIGFGPINNIVT